MQGMLVDTGIKSEVSSHPRGTYSHWYLLSVLSFLLDTGNTMSVGHDVCVSRCPVPEKALKRQRTKCWGSVRSTQVEAGTAGAGEGREGSGRDASLGCPQGIEIRSL